MTNVDHETDSLLDPVVTLGLAKSNPERFTALAISSLGSRSILGASVWEFATKHGAISSDRVTVDASTWVSHSSSQGDIRIGAQPMDSATRRRILFHAERFTYADEISYKLLHEAAHSFAVLTRDLPTTQALQRAAINVRSLGDDSEGLTALGSLNFYRGDSRVVEDIVELMTIYAWDPAYMAEYAVLLADPTKAKTRHKAGLATLGNAEVLYDIVSNAVDVGLNS